jgi:hypothetical protein
MSKETFVEVEPIQRRSRSQSDKQFEKTELNDVAAHSTLVLATAMANAVLSGLELRERKKLRRLAIMIVSGLVVIIGLGQLAILQFLKN